MRKGLKRILSLLLAGIMVAGTMGHAAVVEAAASENVALNKNVVVSDTESSNRPGSNAVDGKTNTHWAGKTHNSWLYVDLGGVYEVESVNVVAYPSGSRYYNYEILGTLDGANWTKIGAETDTTAETINGTTFAADNQKYRFVKVGVR